MESFRKAYGALKDSTKVGLAKVNSEFKVAIKVLIVFHRILREGDPSFREELMHFTRRGHIFEISNFKDDSGPLDSFDAAWDCSAWIRTYALYLEERVECFRNLNFDIESDRAPKSPSGVSKEIKEQSKTPQPNAEELLEQLPSLQQLLYRLICCQPEGTARHNFLVQYALALVVKESFKVYCAINDGIINLVDMFFEMPKHEAVRALDIYKKAGRQNSGSCSDLSVPYIETASSLVFATMEDYIKEAPQAGSVSKRRQILESVFLGCILNILSTSSTYSIFLNILNGYHYNRSVKREKKNHKNPKNEHQDNRKQVKEVENKIKIVHSQEEPVSKPKEVNPPLISAVEPIDLLGLDEVNQKAGQLEESNALALAIVQPGNDAQPFNNGLDEIGKTSGWELALVTAPSNINKPQVAETKMGGGFNKSLLDSLYEDDVARRQLQLQSAGYNTTYGYETSTPQNLFDQRSPYAMPNNETPEHKDFRSNGFQYYDIAYNLFKACNAAQIDFSILHGNHKDNPLLIDDGDETNDQACELEEPVDNETSVGSN
ncbi:hypothetical protein DH2020_039648 [Rehmannia glutinosa]|uniref:ENTH domain-containing protein n=1 Tax=Rehmannia glutinosa TaxID=99300 RepID=A0ABR0UVE4_REHGL